MFAKLFKQEGGFTLVELLVTIAILSMLFGISTLALSGLGDSAQDTVCTAEVAVVQSAIDIYLTVNADNIITVSGAAAVIPAGGTEFSQYLRSDTLGEYSWTAAGVLTVGDCPAPDPVSPQPCGIPGS